VVTATREDTEQPSFAVELADGRTVRSRRLLITTGLVDELPDVPGLRARWGRDVLHCPYCHGFAVRDQAIGILATTSFAAHQAQLFRQLSTDVTVFLHGGPALPDDQAEELAARGIDVVAGEVESLVITQDRLTGVRLRSGKVVPRQALVVSPRFVARAGFLATLGIAAVEQVMQGVSFGTAVAIDANGATRVPGVWAAGNVADLRAQVITAAGRWARGRSDGQRRSGCRGHPGSGGSPPSRSAGRLNHRRPAAAPDVHRDQCRPQAQDGRAHPE